MNKGLKFKYDPTRPGKGVFVAHGKAKEADYKDLPEGTVVISQGLSDEESEGEESAAEVSSIHPTNDSAPSSTRPAAGSGPMPVPHSHTSASRGTPDDAQHPLGLLHMLSSTAVSSGSGPGAGAADAAAGQSSSGPSSSIVNYVPIGPGGPSAPGSGDFANVNPALNAAGSSDVLVMNMLEANPQPNLLNEMAAVDNGLLEGIPGGMFDWGTDSSFFRSR